ncbi:hypothetical protein NPIL_576091 [Nephila pilipes]|uniref:Box C/D snoRNA protein 1 n=1 Tax=Nephila pilipes TaxID=299642 RepID=A0A8X6T5D8_NEPPI|nr:hypothetical protein NPIL_576091 [Nephila pilipes]
MATAGKKEKMKFNGTLHHNLCSTCEEPSKYRCPKCSTLSCSLNCVKAHKEKSGCDGVRDKTAFVPLDEFTDRHFKSDYHFLEDALRTIDNAQRTKRNFGFMNFLPPKLKCICMVFFSDGKIFWKLEWVFPLCNLTYSDTRVDEEQLIDECLDKYLLLDSEDDFNGELDYYRSIGHKDVSVIMKDENTPANETRYFELKKKKSLKENFQGKRIIEFPTLLVVPKMHLSSYLD